MRNPKTISAARIEDTLKTCLPGLKNREEHLCYQYALPTRLGTLLISPFNGAIRTRFEEVPQSAPWGAPLNPYSGKWNFEGLDTEALVRQAVSCIERITP